MGIEPQPGPRPWLGIKFENYWFLGQSLSHTDWVDQMFFENDILPLGVVIFVFATKMEKNQQTEKIKINKHHFLYFKGKRMFKDLIYWWLLIV